MQAKEYADKWSEQIRQEAFAEDIPVQDCAAFKVLLEFLEEIKIICKERHVKRDGAFIGVCKEQLKKYRRFVEIVNSPLEQPLLEEHALRDTLYQIHPRLKELL